MSRGKISQLVSAVVRWTALTWRRVGGAARRRSREMRRAVAALLSLLVASGEAFREENAADVEARHASRDAKTKSQASHCVKAGCLKKNALRYFETWNLHDVSRLKDLFAAEATLRDWDVEVAGRDAVVAANAKIFAAVPGIKIEVLTTHVAVNTTTVVCEILVRTNNEKGEVLKVVDVISFDEESKIVSVRAYKG